VKKTEQYNILGELYKLNLINKKLLKEISDNIEAVFHNESSHKIERWIGLAEIFEPKSQLKVESANSRCSTRCSDTGSSRTPSSRDSRRTAWPS
jgi:hypothetical protein